MKAIMKSIRPRHACNIFNLIKKLETSTTASKEWKDYLSGKTDKKPEPIEVYIYVTKDLDYDLFVENGKYQTYFRHNRNFHVKRLRQEPLNGKVVAKFTLNMVEEIAYQQLPNDVGYDSIFYTETIGNIEKKSCLETSDLINYLGISLKDGGIVGYAWHIDNLVIFDNPKEISEFKTWSKCQEVLLNKDYFKDTDTTKFVSLTRAPQSWCYVEE